MTKIYIRYEKPIRPQFRFYREAGKLFFEDMGVERVEWIKNISTTPYIKSDMKNDKHRKGGE